MMNRKNILIVDDSAMNRAQLTSILEEDYQCHEASGGEEAIQMLEDKRNFYSLVLLDLLMPEVDGYDVLKHMQRKEYLQEIPVIVVTIDSQEESILKAYACGALDLFTKPYIPQLIRKKIADVLHYFGQKHIDPLTGGFNRNAFIYEVGHFLENVDKPTDYAIFFFDINDIKAINEMFGTDAGDEILVIFYNDLRDSALKPLFLSRLDADHYACLAHKDRIDLERAAGRMNAAMMIRGKKVRMHARFGVYYIEEGVYSVPQMIDKAKLAKQSIVDASVKPYEVYEPVMSRNYIGQAEALAEFEEGISNGEFEIFYQPVIEAATGRLASAEALVRWNHPKKGLLSPGAFIPALERNGYITRLDKYMLETIRYRLNRRVEQGVPIVPVSINLSWMDFYDENMKNGILEMMSSDEVCGSKIRLEVTETSYAAMEQDNLRQFRKLHQMGIKILLDDFGSGYSSLGMLEKYDFDILKIDMSFVRKIESNQKSRVIIAKVIECCHELGIEVVAEGAESEEQVNFLRETHCDYIQGYYFSKPLPAEEFVAYVNRFFEQGKLKAE